MNYRNVTVVSAVLIVLGLVTSVFLYLFKDVSVGFVLVAILEFLFIVAGIVLKIIYYRCPHCQGMLPFRSLLPAYCPNCGKPL
jgi:hypothetical protein